ncbi:hypothetical protein GLW20_01635 [Virgibacillus halodenitrificans]|nr:hypothetical protein [Virgibacillus halodenitrificans]
MSNYSVDAELKANVGRYKRAIEKAKEVTEKFKRTSDSVEETELKADIKPLKRNMKIAKRLMQAFTKDKAEKDVDADTTSFFKKLTLLQAKARALAQKGIVLPVKLKTNDFFRKMNRIATTMRSWGEVAAGSFRSGLIALIPMVSPIIASLTGAVGGLASTFAAAGTGAVAFGAVATSALNDVFEANGEIKKLREKLANTSDLEKRTEILKEIEQAQAGLTKEQQKGLKAVQSFSKFWGDFTKQFEKPVIDIFTRSLQGLQKIIKQLEPAFKSATTAANTLSKSMGKAVDTKEFKDFITFLNENAGPALLAMGKVFGNVMQGIMNLMVAFNPLALDMQDGLVGLTEKFKKWSAGLSESKGFQTFVDYVRENGPKVMSLIGNLTIFLIELGKGMASLGTQILDVVNKFLSWSTEMMKAHPIIAKIIAYGITLISTLLAIAPAIILLKEAFGGLTITLIRFGAQMVVLNVKFVAQSAVFIARWAMMGTQALIHASRVVLAWTMTTGKAMVTAMASMAATAVKFTAKWALMGVKALLHAAKVAAAWFVALGPVGWVIATVVALVALIIANWDKVKAWTKKAWSAASNAVSQAWSKVWGKTKEIALNVYNYTKNKFDSAKNAISNAMTSAKNKVSSIWSSIKSRFTNTIGNIVSTVRNKFSDIVSSVREKMNLAKEKVQSAIDRVKGIFDGLNLYKSGKAIIQSAIDGLVSMKNKIVGKVEGIVQKVRNLWPFSPAKEGPLKDIHRMDFAGPIGQSIQRAKNPLIRASSKLAGSVRESFNPDLKVKASQITSSLRSIKRNSVAQVQSAVNTQVEVSKQPANINVRIGQSEFRTFVDDITTVQSREKRVSEAFR